MADESKGNERPDLTAGGVPERLSFPGTEEAVLALWKHLDAFKTQLRLTKVCQWPRAHMSRLCVAWLLGAGAC